MNVFEECAQEYFDANLKVVPIKPGEKIPFVKEWQKKDFSTLIDNFATWGIGLQLGKVSGVVALDIDTDNKEVLNALPPSPVRKRGAKGETRFFKYNGEPCQRFHHKGYEILSDGAQTVIPPTVHPDGMRYHWLGESLLDYGIEHLPALKLPDSPTINIEGATGRHNTLVGIAGAMIDRGDDITTIVNELIAYDQETHDSPYFDDKSERHGGLGYASAIKLVASLMDTAARKGDIYTPAPAIEIDFNKPSEKRRHKKLPNLRGIGAEISEYIYNNAPIPRRETTIASSISTISTLIGNRFRIGSILPNIYSLMVLPSGSGKDFPLKFPQKLFFEAKMDHLIGESHPASDSAIIMQLPDKRVRLDAIDEASILFDAIKSGNSSYLKKMSDVYAQLYTSSGDYFAGKNTASYRSNNNPSGNIGKCYSPYVSIFAAMTPKAFRESFDTKLLQTGLGSRFFIFFDDRKKKVTFRDTNNPIPQNIINYASVWGKKETIVDAAPVESFTIPEMDVTKHAKSMLIEIQDEINTKVMDLTDDSKMKGMYARAFVSTVKLAMIDACSDTYSLSHVKLAKENVEWAYSFVNAMLYNLEDFIDTNVNDNYNEAMFNAVVDAIKSSGKIKRHELTQKTRGIDINKKNNILKELISSGQVANYKGESGATYYIWQG